MKRQNLIHIYYWLVILVFLTLFFGSKWNSLELAFYFSCLLLPIVIGTTYVFNSYLVPKYLFENKHKQFGLYFFYLIVVSLYLEMLMAYLSFIVLANTNLSIVDLDGINVFNLGVSLYLIVFGSSFIKLFIAFRKNQTLITTLQSEKDKNQQQFLNVRASRQNHMVALDELIYIESLDDHVKIVTADNELVTREKISQLSKQLPNQFVRIHRSFIVNLHHVDSYTNTHVLIAQKSYPISRTFKNNSLEAILALGIPKK